MEEGFERPDLNVGNPINVGVLVRPTVSHILAPLMKSGELIGLRGGLLVDPEGRHAAPVRQLDEILQHHHNLPPEGGVAPVAVADDVLHGGVHEEASGSCAGRPAFYGTVYQALELRQDFYPSSQLLQLARCVFNQDAVEGLVEQPGVGGDEGGVVVRGGGGAVAEGARV